SHNPRHSPERGDKGYFFWQDYWGPGIRALSCGSPVQSCPRSRVTSRLSCETLQANWMVPDDFDRGIWSVIRWSPRGTMEQTECMWTSQPIWNRSSNRNSP